MTVIPVGTALSDRKPVGKGFARCYPCEADTRHAVHFRGKYDAMPVNGGWLIEQVCHLDDSILPLLQAHHGPGTTAIDADGTSELPGNVDVFTSNDKRDLGPMLNPLGVT